MKRFLCNLLWRLFVVSIINIFVIAIAYFGCILWIGIYTDYDPEVMHIVWGFLIVILAAINTILLLL